MKSWIGRNVRVDVLEHTLCGIEAFAHFGTLKAVEGPMILLNMETTMHDGMCQPSPAAIWFNTGAISFKSIMLTD